MLSDLWKQFSQGAGVKGAPHLAGEFTGYPEETELVLVRSLSTLPNTWEAIETIPRPYGMLACATLTAEGGWSPSPRTTARTC